MASAEPTPAAAWERLVLFDGVCVFCDGAVRWLMERDTGTRLHFAALQGETAAALRRSHPELPEGIDTMAFVEIAAGEARVSLRSEAAFRAWAEVEPAAFWLRVLRALPRPLTDLAYLIFARLRYRLFGRRESCRVPGPGERDRILP